MTVAIKGSTVTAMDKNGIIYVVNASGAKLEKVRRFSSFRAMDDTT